MQKLLEEITARVGVDGNLADEPSWDYRDIWLGRCVAYIRTLEKENQAMREALVAFKKWDEAEGETPKTTTFDERCGLYSIAAERTEYALSSLTIK